MFGRPLRGIVHDHLFTLQLHHFINDPLDAEEFCRGAEWVLARDPTQGTQVSESVWFLPSAYYIAEPDVASAGGTYYATLVIYYTFDDERVTLLSIQRTGVTPN